MCGQSARGRGLVLDQRVGGSSRRVTWSKGTSVGDIRVDLESLLLHGGAVEVLREVLEKHGYLLVVFDVANDGRVERKIFNFKLVAVVRIKVSLSKEAHLVAVNEVRQRSVGYVVHLHAE